MVGIKPVLFVMAEDTRDADGDGLAGVGITFWYLIRFGEFVSLRDGAKGLLHRIPSEHKGPGQIATARPDAKRTNTARAEYSRSAALVLVRGSWISPADAAALSLALRALTAGKAFSGVAKSSVHEPTRASVRPARAIFLYSEGQSWPALSTTIPLCCNYCRSIARLPSVFFQKFIPYIATVSHTPPNYFWVI